MAESTTIAVTEGYSWIAVLVGVLVFLFERALRRASS